MKTSLLALVCPLLLSPAVFAQTIVSDNFDSYSVGSLTHNTAWGSAIPGTSPALTWQTNPPLNAGSTSGPQAIVSGSVAGRTGNLYHYQENASGQLTTYSSLTLPSVIGAAQWQVSVDFYLEAVTPAVSSWAGLLTLGTGPLTTGANQLASVGISRQSGAADGHISFAITGSTTTFVYGDEGGTGNRIALDQWYTLTITGDQTGKTFIVSIQGAGYNYTSAAIGYKGDHTDFTTLALGDTTANAWAAGRNNSIYLDNFSLQAIPEPSALALIPAALGLFGAARFVRNRRRHS